MEGLDDEFPLAAGSPSPKAFTRPKGKGLGPSTVSASRSLRLPLYMF